MDESIKSSLESKIQYVKTNLGINKKKLKELESLEEELKKIYNLIDLTHNNNRLILEIKICDQVSQGDSIHVSLSNYVDSVEKLLGEILIDLKNKLNQY